MFITHLKFSLRGIINNKLFSFINILGLSISMLCCLLIAKYVVFELSYDKFNTNYKNIYRVNYSRYIDGEYQYKKAQVFPAVGETAKSEIPQVKEFVRLFPVSTQLETLFTIGSGKERKVFQETAVYSADPSFLSVFTLPLIKGDSITALKGDQKVIISESTGYRYFGNDDPIGKAIIWPGMGDFIVTGVFKDLPSNSHMKFDILVSWLNLYEESHEWNWDGFFTYVLLEDGSDKQLTEEVFQSVMTKRVTKSSAQTGIQCNFELQPIKTIHLESNLLGEMEINGSKRTVIALAVIGTIILIIALINYTNLSLARILKRAKEVGIRKINGSSKGQLTSQFFIESLTINVLALMVALGFVALLHPWFISLTGVNTASFFLEKPFLIIAILTGLTLFTSFISSVYPTRYLVVQNPIKSIKGVYNNSPKGTFVKRGLLTFQFLATATLITGTFIVYKQLDFMRNKDLGFQINQKLIIKTFGGPDENIELFKSQIKEWADITNVTITSNIPGRENEWHGGMQSNKEATQIFRTRIDEDFFDTYKIKLLAGRSTSTSNEFIVINESASKMLGFKTPDDAIGKIVQKDSKVLYRDHQIIGVVNDFNERSLHTKVAPSVYIPKQGPMKFITVGIESNIPNTIQLLNTKWKELFPETPFEYFFLDDYFDKQYARDNNLEVIVSLFSGLSIFIACLGLFGFTYFNVVQRIKEIGIRKVLGAGYFSLVNLLSGEFVSLIMLSCVLSIPLAYYLSESWLSQFAYKINLSIVYFILPILIITSVALSTIGLQLTKEIRKNPVDSLKYE
jgi:putative ABC transport system permease protein